MLSHEPRPPDPDSVSGPTIGANRVSVDWADASALANRIARRFCGRHDLAKDVAQDAIYKLMRFNGEILNWQALLTTITVNASFTALKLQQRRQSTVATDSIPAETVVTAEIDPADAAIAREFVLQLDNRFGDGTRAIVELRKIGVPWENIAKIMTLSDRTCRDRYQKALAWTTNQLIPCASKETTHD